MSRDISRPEHAAPHDAAKFALSMFETGKERDPRRLRRIMDLLFEAWSRAPQQRFWQFVTNLQSGWTGESFYWDDDDWERRLLSYLKRDDEVPEMWVPTERYSTLEETL